MNTLSCDYRIYPAWFAGEEAKAVLELAHGSATMMDCDVLTTDVTGHGFDRRGGHYLDFTVTYIKRATQRSTV